MKSNLSEYSVGINRVLNMMLNASFSKSLSAKFVFIFCILLFTPYWQGKAAAQKNTDFATALNVTFNPPAGDKPKTTTGGASRSIGQCINQAENSKLPLTPLVPVNSKGLTVASHPTVLAYLPSSAQKVLFSWQDEDNNHHYQTILPIESQAGIISLTLPEDAPSLEIGKSYQWAVAVMCNGQLQPDSPTIRGQIERVAIEPILSDRLKTVNLLESAALYGEAGIWYETVATLAELKTTQQSDRNLAKNWEELLTSVGLEKITNAPLVNSIR